MSEKIEKTEWINITGCLDISAEPAKPAEPLITTTYTIMIDCIMELKNQALPEDLVSDIPSNRYVAIISEIQQNGNILYNEIVLPKEEYERIKAILINPKISLIHKPVEQPVIPVTTVIEEKPESEEPTLTFQGK